MEIFIEIIGWVGTFLIILAYFLVSYKKVKGDSRIYQFMNLFGAIGVGINIFHLRAWPVFFLQIVWGIIALIVLIKSIKK